MWKREDLAWIAGLVEGEGCIKGTKRDLQLSVSSTDYDVLEMLVRLSGLGVVRGPYARPNPKHKPWFQWTIAGSKAYALLVAIWPWLRQRRRQAFAARLVMWRLAAAYNGEKTTCKNGHEFTEANTYRRRGRRFRQCRVCNAQEQRRYLARRKSVEIA